MNKMLCFCCVVFLTINNAQTYIRPYKPVSINYWPDNLTHSFLEIYLKAKAKSLKNNHPKDNSVARSPGSTSTATSKKCIFMLKNVPIKLVASRLRIPQNIFRPPLLYM